MKWELRSAEISIDEESLVSKCLNEIAKTKKQVVEVELQVSAIYSNSGSLAYGTWLKDYPSNAGEARALAAFASEDLPKDADEIIENTPVPGIRIKIYALTRNDGKAVVACAARQPKLVFNSKDLSFKLEQSKRPIVLTRYSSVKGFSHGKA